MINETIIIAGSAASIGFVHTLLGPDHYLPLVAMAKTNGWSAPKTASYVAVCGVSHLLGTILIGALVFLLGFAFLNLETLQSIRGDFAGWFLLSFGAIYFAWGMNWAIRERRMAGKQKNANFARCTPFALFLFFILGPCEPLIPLMSLGSESVEVFSSILVVSARSKALPGAGFGLLERPWALPGRAGDGPRRCQDAPKTLPNRSKMLPRRLRKP